MSDVVQVATGPPSGPGKAEKGDMPTADDAKDREVRKANKDGANRARGETAARDGAGGDGKAHCCCRPAGNACSSWHIDGDIYGIWNRRMLSSSMKCAITTLVVALFERPSFATHHAIILH